MCFSFFIPWPYGKLYRDLSLWLMVILVNWKDPFSFQKWLISQILHIFINSMIWFCFQMWLLVSTVSRWLWAVNSYSPWKERHITRIGQDLQWWAARMEENWPKQGLLPLFYLGSLWGPQGAALRGMAKLSTSTGLSGDGTAFSLGKEAHWQASGWWMLFSGWSRMPSMYHMWKGKNELCDTRFLWQPTFPVSWVTFLK
jgi:hypothetical protein